MRNRPLTLLAAVIASAGLVLASTAASAASEEEIDRLLLEYATDTGRRSTRRWTRTRACPPTTSTGISIR